MSLPPVTMPPVSATTVRRRGISRRNALWLLLLTLALSAAYLLIDFALDPALLPHAVRAGRLLVLLVLAGVAYFMSWCIILEVHSKRTRVERLLNTVSSLLVGPMFPIWSIFWLDPYLPNVRYATVALAGIGIANIGFTPCVLALLYGLLAARKRYETEGAYTQRSILAREQVVGFEPLVWVAAVIWFLMAISASIYGIWLALSLTNTSDNATFFVSLAIICGSLVVVIVPFFWLLHRIRVYARQTGDASLFASAHVPSTQRAMPQRVELPPEERARWGIALLIGLGLLALSLLTFAVLDRYLIQSVFTDGTPRRIAATFATFMPVFSWMGLHRASARRYEPARFRQLLVAAAAFTVAGDALLVDMTHPHHSIVPPLGLLAIAVLCSTLGVLICRSLLLHPMWEGNAEPTGVMPADPALAHETAVAGSQRRPRFAPYFVLMQPLLIVAVHLIYYYGDAATIKEWGSIALMLVGISIAITLSAVVNTDMPLPHARRPAPKGV